MTTLCVDVPYNYFDTPNIIAFASNTDIKPEQRSRVLLPNNILGKKLKLKNFIYRIDTIIGEDHTDKIGYFKLQLSFGSRAVSSSYVITHNYDASATSASLMEEAIALPFSTTETSFNGCWSEIQLPSTAQTEMFIDVSVPLQATGNEFAFTFLTLWFDVL